MEFHGFIGCNRNYASAHSNDQTEVGGWTWVGRVSAQLAHIVQIIVMNWISIYKSKMFFFIIYQKLAACCFSNTSYQEFLQAILDQCHNHTINSSLKSMLGFKL